MSTDKAIREALISNRTVYLDGNPATLVDVLDRCADGLFAIARALGEGESGPPVRDAYDGYVRNVTEGLIGITEGLSDIAKNIYEAGEMK